MHRTIDYYNSHAYANASGERYGSKLSLTPNTYIAGSIIFDQLDDNMVSQYTGTISNDIILSHSKINNKINIFYMLIVL